MSFSDVEIQAKQIKASCLQNLLQYLNQLHSTQSFEPPYKHITPDSLTHSQEKESLGDTSVSFGMNRSSLGHLCCEEVPVSTIKIR